MNVSTKDIRKRDSRSESESHPSGDSRFKMLDTTLKKNRFQPDSLIEILHAAQGLFGYLSEDVLLYVSHALKLPPSRVYGAATFYHLFSLEPLGDHSCSVCLGTACYVKGAQEIVDKITAEFGLEMGQTRADKKLSFASARCLGSCGLAPVLVIDGQVVGKETPMGTVERLKKIINNDITV